MTSTLPQELTVNRYTVAEVSKITGYAEGGLRQMRFNGRGPKFYRWAGKLVCDEPDLVAWCAAQKARTAIGGEA
ncbi:hypothetical protein [Rhodococcus sp. 1139]|uniref:hypothetical protein n=1 Tax=Rhodococcus sp. 1139 TaxID=1833762 RepID=UPI00114D346F|nr:hypothetical protein [Rhodococcus sp. 1139]